MRVAVLILLLFGLLQCSFGEPESEDDSCGDEPPLKKLKTACYFATSRTSPLEKPREEKFKFSEDCEGDVFDLVEFADDHSGQLCGAPHRMGLILARTEGTFLDSSSDLTQWEGKGICQKHFDEISRRYFIDQSAKKRVAGHPCSSCLYPEPHSSQGASGTRVMSYQMSRNVLEMRNLFVPVGAPLCDRHYKGIPKKPLKIVIPTTTPAPLDLPPADAPAPLDLPPMEEPAPLDLPPMEEPAPLDLPPMEEPAPLDLPTYTVAPTVTPPLGESSNSHTSHFANDCIHDPLSSACSQASAEDSQDEDYCIPNSGRQYSVVESAVFSLFKAANIERGRCTKPFSEYAERTQKNKSRTVLEIVRIIVGVMTSTAEEYELLMSMVTAMLVGKTPKDENAILHSLLTTTAENFNRLRKHNEKIELLSFFAHSILYRTMTNYIPNLSERMWNDAKKRAMSPVRMQPNLAMREKYSPVKLDYLISFVTSSHIQVSIPYGQLKTKDSAGNIITLPNSIRLTGIYETIELYEKWMDQKGLSSLKLSNSTSYKILSKMPALRSSSQTCVDYYQASATMAFIKIEEILKSLIDMNQLDSSEAKTLKRAFDEIQAYLRTDYKLHVKEQSRISDHCINLALSDPDDHRFASLPETPHDHDRKCPMCEQMAFILSDMKKRIDTMVEESNAQNELGLLDIQNDFNNAIEKIVDLKAHIVRTVFTSMEREAHIRGLQEGEGFITLDFAQKWLPSYFRETQKDFFGKPGYSWHFAHVYAKVSGELVQHVYIHILKNEIQDGRVVVELIKHISEDLSKMGINKLHLRSDNAGYYHSAPVMATIPAIEKKYGVDITWSFSESQSGKSSADRYASYAKHKMRIFLSQRKNIDSHEMMFVALTQGKQLRGVSVHLATVDLSTPMPKTKISGISSLGHFEFNDETISAWKFRGFGEGMRVKGLEGITSSIQFHEHGGKLSTDVLKDEEKQKIANGEEPHFWLFPAKKTTEEPGDVDDEAVTGVTGQAAASDPSTDSSALFMCPKCSASFLRESNLIRHLDKGQHKIRPVKVSQIDFALGLYKRMLEELQQGVGITPFADSFKDYQEASAHPKPMGWALRSTRKGGRYNPKSKQMVVDLFEEYYRHSKKLRPEEAERKMRERGDILPAERMSHEQIKNLLRTLVAAKKKELENSGIKSRRRRALMADMENELEEEGAWIEEEVAVHEDEAVITAQAIYDMIQLNPDEFFIDFETPEEPGTDIGTIDD